ncbi:MAG: hypothetical protein COV79_02205 [Parcubacteria group bacterium CG11_big_fil_rev_8_21_14_0_20_41_14]|nr:MAG: hypothetical protein COV79_02205 [Parcubacteria group bacterium CG11_big_fil_rev_8_21_14_0_20_41_14]PIZ78777.1 MAG: hypothetical protein COY02_04080 [Parcubacteria group bacterium CG_4_10_14_0_2_um_filter_41_6]
MLLLSAVALLLFWADAASAEKDGWDVYRLARPQGIAKMVNQSPALGKILAPFGVPKGPPIEYDRTVTMDSVTIVIGPSEPAWETRKWIPVIKKNDIVLLKGDPPYPAKAYNVIEQRGNLVYIAINTGLLRRQ